MYIRLTSIANNKTVIIRLSPLALHCLLDSLATTASVLDGHNPIKCTMCHTQEPSSKTDSDASTAASSSKQKSSSASASPKTTPTIQRRQAVADKSEDKANEKVGEASKSESTASKSGLSTKLNSWWKVRMGCGGSRLERCRCDVMGWSSVTQEKEHANACRNLCTCFSSRRRPALLRRSSEKNQLNMECVDIYIYICVCFPL